MSDNNNGKGLSSTATTDRHDDVVFDEEAHSGLLRGAEILFKAVKSTMGPSGHNVIIDNGVTAPLITKDGVTVAKAINLKDRLPSIGAELLKEIAAKTNELAGDGTTTSVVLGHSMLAQGVKMIATGRSSIGIKRGMDVAANQIVCLVKDHATPVSNTDDIINVGTVSANGDRSIGELLSEAISKVGPDGIITIEPAKSVKTTLDVVEGMQFESGYVSPYFVTNQEKLVAELNDPYVLITDRKITSIKEILKVMEQVANTNKPLLVIADEIEGEALHTLLVNKMKGVLYSCAVKAPSYGENRSDLLSDIALVTGGTVIDSGSAKHLENVTLSDLGTCKKAIVGRGTTTLVSEDGSRKQLVQERAGQLKSLMDSGILTDDLKRENTRKRLAKLAGGVAVIKVGGSTEVEIFEKKDRVEDALNATVAAVQEGILPGGGTALFTAASMLEKSVQAKEFGDELSDDELAGVRVVIESCKMPLRVIVENTGKSADVVMHELTSAFQRGASFQYGYDANKHVFCELIQAGIIDPLKVERAAVLHASSVIGLLLTTNCVVCSTADTQARQLP